MIVCMLLVCVCVCDIGMAVWTPTVAGDQQTGHSKRLGCVLVVSLEHLLIPKGATVRLLCFLVSSQCILLGE